MAEFLRVNYLIAWVWVAAFAIEALSGFYGDAILDDSNNIWTGWIVQTLPPIIVGAVATKLLSGSRDDTSRGQPAA